MEKNFGMASCNQGYGSLYIKKGSWDLYTSDIEMGVGATDHPTVDFTLDGDEASFDAHATPIYVGIRSSCATYNFNFNGGVMRCGGIRRISRYYNKTEFLTNMVLCVNFNGGTFKAGDNSRNLFGYGAATDYSDLWATNVAVYAGGATIDTDGKTGSRLDTPIRGAWGKGVKSIALAEPIKGINYISSPRVIITGDGIGASAFAHFDSTNMVVDRIIVTAPGCGYTSATGTIYYGRNVYKTLTSDAGEIVLEDNANTGSFTKAGEGDLTLYATNTWGGATVLKGGTLKAGCDWAVPTNSAVVLGGGGVLDLNGKAARISSIEYTAGGGSIVNASAAELPATFSLRTTLEDILADRAIVFSGDQDLSGVTLTVEGDDYSALDKNAPRHRVLTVTGGRLVSAPNIAAALPPAPWAYTVRPDGIILNYVKGSIFIMR
jgi:autotransporter-associated beta strand protein